MKAEIWTAPDCELCEKIQQELVARGYEIEEKLASDLTSGIDRNTDALVQLAMQNMALPVVWISDHGFVNPRDFCLD